MKENEEKENPHPSRMRGRGVEVSKTLFYDCWYMKQTQKNSVGKICSHLDIKSICGKIQVNKGKKTIYTYKYLNAGGLCYYRIKSV